MKNRVASIIKKTVALAMTAIVILLASTALSSCGKKTIIIYTSAEDFRIDHLQSKIKEKFPEYNVIFEYKSSGDHAAVLKAAGKNAGCHIFYDLEYGYATEIASNGTFANLSSICDFSIYTDDAIVSEYFVPTVRSSGAIILNMDVINEKNLDIPQSYEDLLDPQYKNLISMPNPKTSGTGYMFLLSLVNAWGEDVAFEYFDSLSNNVLSFSSSGSGPVNALVGKEVAIGLGMTAHAVEQINEGENLKILYFDEGAPNTLYAQGIISGYEMDEAVVQVFEYLSTVLSLEQCEKFYPEKIFKEEDFVIQNYPSEIVYSNMMVNTPQRKSSLLEKWSH